MRGELQAQRAAARRGPGAGRYQGDRRPQPRVLVVLWRGGLRIAEALALRPVDLDAAAGPGSRLKRLERSGMRGPRPRVRTRLQSVQRLFDLEPRRPSA